MIAQYVDNGNESIKGNYSEGSTIKINPMLVVCK